MKHKLLFLISKILISFTVIYFVFKQITVNDYLAYFKYNFFDLKILFSVFGLFLLTNFIISLRWYLIINYSNKRIHFDKVLRASLYSNIFTTLSIPTLTDISRIMFLKDINVNKKELTITVVIDRFIGLVSKIIFTIFVLLFVKFFININFFNIYIFFFIFLLIISIVLFILIKSNFFTSFISKFKTLKETVIKVKNNYNIRVIDLIYLAIFSLSVHCILSFMFYLICSQADIPNKLIISLLSPIIVIIGQIPFFFGGWGIREVAFISIFSLLSIPSQISVSVSIYFGLVTTAFSLIFLFFWLIETLFIKIFTNK